jgi:hypothetical protein
MNKTCVTVDANKKISPPKATPTGKTIAPKKRYIVRGCLLSIRLSGFCLMAALRSRNTKEDTPENCSQDVANSNGPAPFAVAEGAGQRGGRNVLSDTDRRDRGRLAATT